jgi:hypothetical protein
MAAEWHNKTENPVVKIERPSSNSNGSFGLIRDWRVRQPLVAKEPLCGNQSANLSLVIAVFAFSVLFCCSAVFVYEKKEDGFM